MGQDTHEKMEKEVISYSIDGTDVILTEYGIGKGKIIVADLDGYNFSYYWGAMGERTLREFILQLNGCYFTDKLNRPKDLRDFCIKKTMANVRRYIRDEINWYDDKEAQKELRTQLNYIQEHALDHNDFVSRMQEIGEDLTWCIIDKSDDFDSLLECLADSPWHWIEWTPSRNELFLNALLPKLQEEIKKHA